MEGTEHFISFTRDLGADILTVVSSTLILFPPPWIRSFAPSCAHRERSRESLRRSAAPQGSDLVAAESLRCPKACLFCQRTSCGDCCINPQRPDNICRHSSKPRALRSPVAFVWARYSSFPGERAGLSAGASEAQVGGRFSGSQRSELTTAAKHEMQKR